MVVKNRRGGGHARMVWNAQEDALEDRIMAELGGAGVAGQVVICCCPCCLSSPVVVFSATMVIAYYILLSVGVRTSGLTSRMSICSSVRMCVCARACICVLAQDVLEMVRVKQLLWRQEVRGASLNSDRPI